MSSKSRFRPSPLRRRGNAPRRHTALSIEGLEPRQMMTATATSSLNSLGTQISSVASAVSGLIVGDRYENDNTAARATTISTNGTSQEHSIHAGADVDWVKFTLTERSNVIISTSGASGDTRMWLYGPNSSTQQIDFDDDDGIGAFSQIERTGSISLAPGTYYVKIDEYGNNDTIANYSLRVTATPVGPASDQYEDDNTASRATPIRIDGTAQTHTIHTGSDVDWVKFTLAQQSNVVIETSGSSGDTRMWLYGPNSSTRQVDFNDDSGSGAFSRIERSGSNSLAPGTYYVKVDEYGNNDTIANYSIRVQATVASSPVTTPDTPPVTIMPIVLGDDYANELQGAYQLTLDTAERASASGSIERSGDVDMFRFVARGSGQTTIEQIASQNSGFDTYLYIYDSQGREITHNDDYGGTRNSHVTFNATAGETYYVKAAAYSSGTGTYQLAIAGQPAISLPPVVINPPITPVVPIQPADDFGNTLQNATTLTLAADGSAAASGVIERSGDVDMFRFTARTTGRMTIDQQATSGSHLDTYLYVYDSRGQELTHNDDSGGTLNSHVETNVLAGETYFVKATAFNNSTGAYRVQLAAPVATSTTGAIVSLPVDSLQELLDAVPSAAARDALFTIAGLDGVLRNSPASALINGYFHIQISQYLSVDALNRLRRSIYESDFVQNDPQLRTVLDRLGWDGTQESFNPVLIELANIIEQIVPATQSDF